MIILVAAGWIPASADGSQKAPKRAEEPFRVAVAIEPEEDVPEQRRALLDAEQELEKRFDDNENWFQLVDSADEAEIVVRLLAYSSRADRRVKSIWGVVPPTEDRQPDRTQVIEIHTFHALRATVELFGAQRTLSGEKTTTSSPGGPADAAKDLAESIEALCKERYWELVAKRRER